MRKVNHRRGFGFVQFADGEELFVGNQELRRYGVKRPLRTGQDVAIATVQNEAGMPSVVRFSFLANQR